jgi:hypothetical protein
MITLFLLLAYISLSLSLFGFHGKQSLILGFREFIWKMIAESKGWRVRDKEEE